MGEKPILFSGPMILALLAGRKTQTRRILKDQSVWDRVGEGILRRYPHQKCGTPIVVGDRLWVREAAKRAPHLWTYAADGTEIGWPGRRDLAHMQRDSIPSIHLPRTASRITLDVTDVRVQRLQEISADDAIAEGVSQTEYWRPEDVAGRPFEEKWWDDLTFWTEYPQIAFRSLWESINGPGSWEANPWVVAYTFIPSGRAALENGG